MPRRDVHDPGGRSGPTTTEPPVLRVRDPVGAVAAVPYLLGFAPTASGVALGVRADGALGLTLRWDLEGLARDTPGGTTTGRDWDEVRTVLRRNGCPDVIVLLYGGTDPADTDHVATDLLLDVLCGAPSPPTVRDVVLVGATRFRSLLCRDDACCPAEGVLLAQAACHPVAAGLVVAGLAPVAARELLEPVDDGVTAAQRQRAATAARRAERQPPGGGGTPGVDLLDRWRACLPQGPDPVLAGTLAAAWTADARLRDACLASFLPDGARLGEQVLAGTAGGDGSSALSRTLSDPRCAGTVRAAAVALRRLAALAPPAHRADVLAGHAWLAWVSGEGTVASVLADRALGLDPEQSLADLVVRCLGAGLGPPWTL